MIQSQKYMLTIVWNPRGFHSVNVREKGQKFNARHDVTERLSPFPEWCASDAPESHRQLMLDADNAQPHTARLSVELCENNRMKTAPHVPYSPEIAPSDFSFFGHVKGCLIDRSFLDTEELFEAVRGILDSIEKVTFQAVFRGA
jgi:hypothetical protein